MRYMVKMLINPIKSGIGILLNPEREFKSLNKRSLEPVVWNYAILLVASALMAGIFNLIFSIAKASYFDLLVDVGIQYMRMINYSIGRSTSIIFFYLFAGTFLLFFLSIILRPFFRNIKYASLLKILLYSATPMLLFGWLLTNPFPLAIWSMLLMYAGVKNHKCAKISKDSIEMRE